MAAAVQYIWKDLKTKKKVYDYFKLQDPNKIKTEVQEFKDTWTFSNTFKDGFTNTNKTWLTPKTNTITPATLTYWQVEWWKWVVDMNLYDSKWSVIWQRSEEAMRGIQGLWYKEEPTTPKNTEATPTTTTIDKNLYDDKWNITGQRSDDAISSMRYSQKDLEDILVL